jgi:glycosyltransferase involved in cell wall biosynthesis
MIDLCVVNYNVRPLLQRFLESLHSDIQDNVWNLFIADNGSTDDSHSWMGNNFHKYKIENYFRNKNIGYSAACNGLAGYGSGDIIALLNSDVWLTTSDLVAIQKIFDEEPDIHILGPKQRDENGFITHAGITGTNDKPVMRGWRDKDPEDALYKDRVNCVTVSGSAYFIRRSVWLSMTYHPKYQNMYPGVSGAFLPTPHYYEETWCSYFARHLGYNIVYDGSVSIGHSWHKSSAIGGEADQKFKISQKLFKDACDAFGIERENFPV